MSDDAGSVATENTLPLPEQSVGELFGGAALDDKNRAFELAEIERRLFGTDSVEPFRVGRFTVMEKLGSGGMGVVYAAFDPQLERKIAVKFLRSDLEGADARGAARLLREAQALAKLGHPNVVSVYDVGNYDGGVYVAMEFVRGLSLGEWVKRENPSWPEILEAYLQAGQGLAAAHAAGIVHRDFKPENALRGEDGRVRVLDFGLAAPTVAELAQAIDESRSDTGDPAASDAASFADPLTRTGAVMGTPLYMAPEQHLGERADARCDQFAFCVSLWVALFGERPFPGTNMVALAHSVTNGHLRPLPRAPRLPKRVRSAIVRGLHRDPAQRFESIDELLAELDVGARRRRTLLVGASGLGLAAAVGGLLAWQLRANTNPSLCDQTSERLDQAWNEATAMDATARFAKTDAERTWKDLHTQLDRSKQDWQAAHDSVCSDEAVDLEQLSCLEWRLQEIETITKVLASAEPDELHLVAQGAAAFMPPSACTDAKTLASMLPPPRDPQRRARVQALRTEIARANVLHRAGRHVEALAAARSVVDTAADLEEAAVEAESLILLGEVLAEGGARDEAESTLREALRRAETAGHDTARARALAVLIGVVGFGAGRPTAELEDRFDAVRQRLGELPSRAVADYLLAVTMVRIGHGRIEESHAAAQAALTEVERLGLDTVKAQAQLGLTLTLLGRYEDAQPVLQALTDSIDDQHPSAVLVLGICGIHRGFLGRDREALEFFGRALELEGRRQQAQPHYRALVGTYMANSVERLGDFDKAVLMQRASIAALKELWGDQHGTLGRAHYHLATSMLDHEQWEQARKHYERSREIWQVTHGEMHRAMAYPETGLARILLHEGKADEGLAMLEGALPKLSLGEGHRNEEARTHFHLARAIVATGGDQTRALDLARHALGLLDGLGPGHDRDRKAISEWLEAHAPSAETPAAHPQTAP